MLSPRQKEIRQREVNILGAARGILVDRGYYGLTMDRIAEAAECPKGTMYQRFGCKEDVILALASQCLEERLALITRAAAFKGRARERMAAIGEAVALYERLNPANSQILHLAMGPIREKGSPERVMAVVFMETKTVDAARGVIRAAAREGDLSIQEPCDVERLAFGLWALVEGSYVLIESGAAHSAVQLDNPFYAAWRMYNLMADGCGWRPLFKEWDWEETLASVRRTIFPEESQRLYGEGAWYGDGA